MYLRTCIIHTHKTFSRKDTEKWNYWIKGCTLSTFYVLPYYSPKSSCQFTFPEMCKNSFWDCICSFKIGWLNVRNGMGQFWRESRCPIVLIPTAVLAYWLFNILFSKFTNIILILTEQSLTDMLLKKISVNITV